MSVENLVEGIIRNYPQKEASEAIMHIGNLKLFGFGSGSVCRMFLGLADNIFIEPEVAEKYSLEDWPYNNVICYKYDGDSIGLRFLICGVIIRDIELLNAKPLLKELRAML